jgi:predicted aspartyl protease
LPIRIAGGHLYTTVKLNGVELRMIIDTGAEWTTVSKAAATRMGLSFRRAGDLYGVGGYTALYGFQAKTFEIGHLHGHALPLAVSDISFDDGEEQADGLLGADYLSGYDMDLDISGKIGLFKVLGQCSAPVSSLPEPVYQAGFMKQEHPDDISPRVAVQIGGHHLTAIIDTGAPRSAIFRNAAYWIGLDADALATHPDGTTTGVGPRTVRVLRRVTPPITIGEITIANLPIDIIDQRLRDTGVDMLLGMDFFAHVHGWLSFSSHTLLMQYPPLPSPPRPGGDST